MAALPMFQMRPGLVGAADCHAYDRQWQAKPSHIVQRKSLALRAQLRGIYSLLDLEQACSRASKSTRQ